MITIELKNSVLAFFKNKDRNFLIIGQFLGALLSVIIGKLTAIYIVPEKFGLFNLQFVAYTFFFSLFISPFLQFMKPFSASKLQTMGHNFVLKILAVLVLFCSIALIVLFHLKFHVSFLLLVLILITLVTNIGYNLITDFFNVKGMLSIFTWSTILKGLFSLAALFIAVKIFLNSENAELVLWIVQIAGFFFGVFFFLKSYKYIRANNYDQTFKDFLREYSKYAWPLMILAFWSWINSYFDRYVIEYYMELKEVGIYNANLGLGSKIFLLLNPVFLALLTPIAFNVKIKLSEKKKIINKYALFYVLIGIAVLAILYLTNETIGEILLSDLYKEGFFIIFWAAVAYFIITLTYIYELLLFAESKTKVILLSNVISAVANVLLVFLLIPKFGLQGAIAGLIVASILRVIYIKLVFINYGE